MWFRATWRLTPDTEKVVEGKDSKWWDFSRRIWLSRFAPQLLRTNGCSLYNWFIWVRDYGYKTVCSVWHHMTELCLSEPQDEINLTWCRKRCRRANSERKDVADTNKELEKDKQDARKPKFEEPSQSGEVETLTHNERRYVSYGTISCGFSHWVVGRIDEGIIQPY